MLPRISHIFSFIAPQKIEVVKSKIQGDITVEYYRGEYRVTVNSFWQSGSYARGVMRAALHGLLISQKSIRKILFLGIGPGSMVHVIRESFPMVHITGVDIDPAMLDIGRTYFHVQNDDKTSLIVSDAWEYVKKLKKNELFQIIVSDLFIGCDTWENLRSRTFLNKIYVHLEKGGVYISNSSYIEKYKRQTDVFVEYVREIFDSVEIISRNPNRIIRGYRK
ncbi:fused MFS/spermidine synthase [Candidatus Gottesmanbacteria bacterium]|nr:fused MFS/spermidine synthase [Candidatus Gottesmanbacteria bacterium]